jgi:hypothetical protein
MISEVFREVDFDDPEEARQQRDLRVAVLQAQGLVCVAENLYRVDGKRVYLLTADAPKSNEPPTEKRSSRSQPRRDRPVRAPGRFEQR